MSILTFGLSSYSQNPIVLSVTQADPLVAHAGADKAINKGESIVIGGSPSASLGYGSYGYSWSPSAGLDNPTLANPTATPGANTTYLLTVRDANNCSATDEVAVLVDASGMDVNPAELTFRCYPNPVEEVLLVELTGIASSVTIRLMDPIGKEMIYQITRMGGTEAVERIPMQKFPAGIYYLQLITEKAAYYQPIIKTR